MQGIKLTSSTTACNHVKKVSWDFQVRSLIQFCPKLFLK